MSACEKFRIHKTDDPAGPWYLDYPDGFDDNSAGLTAETFEQAVADFIEAAERQCFYCEKGAVVDTLTGWECLACGSSDTAAPPPGGPR